MPTVVPLPDTSRDLRNAVLCALAVIIAVAATWPVAELPYNDDWSYSWTVKQLDLTGHLTYNGWASASLIAQAYWGLIWVKIFGFHLTVLRLSTVPFAAGAVAVCYLLGRRAGLAPRWAVLASLTLGWSPIFLPVAATFMTDAPGLFCILFSLYTFIRAIESNSKQHAISWIIGGTAVGLIGGTGRQIVWLAPLVGLPYTALVCRGSRAIVITACGGFIGTVVGALLTLRWFNHQPYAIPEPSVLRDLLFGLMHAPHMGMSVLSIGLTLMLASLPGLPGLLRTVRAERPTWITAILLLLIFVAVLFLRPRYGLMPWMENTLEPTGVMGKSELSGHRPTVLTLPIRIGLSILTMSATALMLAMGIVRLRRINEIPAFFLNVRGQTTPARPQPIDQNRPVTPRLLILFALAYTAFLLPRAARDMAYDRYVLELIPCLLIPLLRFYQPGKKTGAIAWILLIVWGLYGIAATQEVTALARTRVIAASRVTDAGYARCDLTGGFEYDFITEIINSGYINDYRLQNPRGAYKGGDPTPTVIALYRLEFTTAVDTKPTRFGSVEYFSLLPPFHRKVLIDEFIDPWWRAPGWLEAHRYEHRNRASHMVPTTRP